MCPNHRLNSFSVFLKKVSGYFSSPVVSWTHRFPYKRKWLPFNNQKFRPEICLEMLWKIQMLGKIQGFPGDPGGSELQPIFLQKPRKEFLKFTKMNVSLFAVSFCARENHRGDTTIQTWPHAGSISSYWRRNIRSNHPTMIPRLWRLTSSTSWPPLSPCPASLKPICIVAVGRLNIP